MFELEPLIFTLAQEIPATIIPQSAKLSASSGCDDGLSAWHLCLLPCREVFHILRWQDVKFGCHAHLASRLPVKLKQEEEQL